MFKKKLTELLVVSVQADINLPPIIVIPQHHLMNMHPRSAKKKQKKLSGRKKRNKPVRK